MDNIKFYRKPRLKNPYLIVAWPGMGEVAFKAVQYLVQILKARECATITPERFFYLSGSIIRQGMLALPELPFNKFFYWKDPRKKNDLLMFLSNSQPDLSKGIDYCNRILSVAKSFNVRTVICFAAMPVPISHTQNPAVWFASTTKRLKEQLLKYSIKMMSEGQISGMNGLFLGVARKKGLEGFCLLGEVPIYTIQIENPRASAAVLRALGKILGLVFDLKPVYEQARAIEEQISQLVDYLKQGAQPPPPIGKEEIENMKRSLSQYSKLPQSARERIERLFEQARKDIAKANELKKELDSWNVYKEYEDRFLDLFKKPKDKGN
jgi:hypothetical protein